MISVCHAGDRSKRELHSPAEEDAAMSIAEEISSEMSYESLKQYIIKSKQKSQGDAIDAAMADVLLNDLKPSQLFRKMEILMRDAGINHEHLIRHKFMKSLPDNLRASLACHIEKPLKEFIKLADSIHEYSPKIVNAISTTPIESSITEMLTELRNEINLLKREKHHGNSNIKYCYFHNRFGKMAKKCTTLSDGSRCQYNTSGNEKALSN